MAYYRNYRKCTNNQEFKGRCQPKSQSTDSLLIISHLVWRKKPSCLAQKLPTNVMTVKYEEENPLIKCFRHVIMELLGVHAHYMKIFGNNSSFLFVHFTAYRVPVRIKIAPLAYVTAHCNDLLGLLKHKT